MRRLLLAAAVLSFVTTLPAQPRKYVVDGQPLRVRGTLTMSPAGRLQFVTVSTSEAYVPVWKDEQGRQEDGEVLHGIGLSVPVPYAVLYAHRGQQVTAFGKLQVDEASPYFWHATRLEATSIKLADGTDLMKRAPEAPQSVAVAQTYTITALLPADLAEPWRYRMAGIEQTSTPASGLLGCSSNGGGDVVNCFCADGFHATRTDAVVGGKHVSGRLLEDSAQFDVADEDGKTAMATTLIVTCSR